MLRAGRGSGPADGGRWGRVQPLGGGGQHVLLRVPRHPAAPGRRLRLGHRLRLLPQQHDRRRHRLHLRHLPPGVRQALRREPGQDRLGRQSPLRNVPQRRSGGKCPDQQIRLPEGVHHRKYRQLPRFRSQYLLG